MTHAKVIQLLPMHTRNEERKCHREQTIIPLIVHFCTKNLPFVLFAHALCLRLPAPLCAGQSMLLHPQTHTAVHACQCARMSMCTHVNVHTVTLSLCSPVAHPLTQLFSWCASALTGYHIPMRHAVQCVHKVLQGCFEGGICPTCCTLHHRWLCVKGV